jgi:hypothetical protein
VYKPIRTSPEGSPMLIISAFDSKLAKTLETRQEAKSKFKVGKSFSLTMTVKAETDESLQLFL